MKQANKKLLEAYAKLVANLMKENNLLTNQILDIELGITMLVRDIMTVDTIEDLRANIRRAASVK